MQRYFDVTPPSVHQMVVTLEQKGLISRRRGTPRSIQVLLPKGDLPDLE
jgi:repressor LexA